MDIPYMTGFSVKYCMDAREFHTPGKRDASYRQAVWPAGIVYVARWVVFRAARSPPRSSAAVGRWGRRAPAARRAPDEARRGSGKLRRKRPALLGDAYHVLCMHSNEVSVLVRVGGGGGAAGQLGGATVLARVPYQE